MRKITNIYKDGDTRIRTKFLWFPVSVLVNDRQKETRYWEHVIVYEIYENNKWVIKKFLNKKELPEEELDKLVCSQCGREVNTKEGLHSLLEKHDHDTPTCDIITRREYLKKQF